MLAAVLGLPDTSRPCPGKLDRHLSEEHLGVGRRPGIRSVAFAPKGLSVFADLADRLAGLLGIHGPVAGSRPPALETAATIEGTLISSSRTGRWDT